MLTALAVSAWSQMQALIAAYADEDSDHSGEEAGAPAEALEPPDPSRGVKRPLASVLPDAEELLADRPTPDPHHGRVRQFPHVVGEFNSLVYVPAPPSEVLRRCVEEVIAQLQRDERASPMHPLPLSELHMSVSQSFTLLHSQILPFTDALQKALRGCPAFTLRTAGVAALHNDTRTCHFAALVLQPVTAEDANRASRLLAAVNHVMDTFGKPRFYEPPILHLSIAWSLEPLLRDQPQIKLAGVETASQGSAVPVINGVGDVRWNASCVEAKMGTTKVHRIALASSEVPLLRAAVIA